MINVTVEIANGTALSNSVDLDGLVIMGVVMPATWTASGVGFQTSHDGGGTYQPAYDYANALLQIATAEQGKNYYVNPAATLGFSQVKVWSQTAGVDVNQGAARTVTLVCATAKDF